MKQNIKGEVSQNFRPIIFIVASFNPVYDKAYFVTSNSSRDLNENVPYGITLKLRTFFATYLKKKCQTFKNLKFERNRFKYYTCFLLQ